MLRLGVLLAICLLAFPACSSDEVRPSPLPPGYAMRLQQQQAQPTFRTTGGRTVDQLMAVVDGQYLTRREVLRRLRLSEAEATSGDVEEEILEARKEWARQRLVMAAARRAGMSVPPSTIDNIAEEQLAKEMKSNLEATGEDLDRTRYLRARNLTWTEYREQIKGLILAEFYMRKVTRGVGGGRPDIDWGVDPHEVRRVYARNRKAFDVPEGVRMAILRFPLERFEREGLDLIEVEALAQNAAQSAQRDLQSGVSLDDVIRRYGLTEEDIQRSGDGEFIPKPEMRPDRPVGQDVQFLFDPSRRVGDARVFPLADGPHVMTVLEKQSARTRTLEEVYPTIVKLIQQGKVGRATAQLTIEQITRGGSVVWPQSLADELIVDANKVLADIAEHPVLGTARLR
ncbi:MAG: peptidylprolyl isomerase [Planctomycetota bacterium]|nr:peptidylprolyl isomerase [Planctomycetota bacterium]